MRLTTARYYTPSGVSIQATGISADIKVALARIEALDGGDTREEDLKGALDNGEGGKNGEPTKTKKTDVTPAADQSEVDYQLARALDLIRGVSIFTDVKSGS